MKRICYVVTIPLTIRSFFVSQLRYLSEHGFEVSVICSNDGSIKDDLGEKIKYIPVKIPRGVSVFKSIRTVRTLVGVFKREHFDIIQYSTPNAGFCASLAAKWTGCSVRNYHLMGFRYLSADGIKRLILKEIEKIACRNSTSIECVSKSNRELGIEEGLFSPSKATVVWNGSSGGVNLDRFDIFRREIWRSEIREKLNISESEFVFGFVGRITRDKGINELLEAYFKLNDGSRLILIGDIDDKSGLDQELFEKAYKCGKISFIHFMTDIERYYSAIDALILPSYREGFGNVVIEAAAVGTPVIVSNIPGPVDAVVPGETGYLAEPKNVDSLQKAMEKIKNSDYKGMGMSAAKFVKDSFDSDKLNEHIFVRKQMLISQQKMRKQTDEDCNCKQN